MEELGDGGGGATRLRQQHISPSSDRILGILQPEYTSVVPPVELSEHDIFNTPSWSSSSSPTYSASSPNSLRNGQSHTRAQYGIVAALDDNIRSRSGCGSDIRSVFNHKASLSSSSSISPAASATARVMIPKRHPPQPPVDRVRLRHQSAPVNVPIVPALMMRKASDLENVLSEEDIEDKEKDLVILPPHEVLAARHSPVLSSSVLEGAGRTLKGRDLRQVVHCNAGVMTDRKFGL